MKNPFKDTIQDFWKKVRFNQKKEWDQIAYSYLIKSESKKPILDIGCGIGRFIEQNPDRIIGIDWNANSIEKCRKKGYTVKRADSRELPFKSNEFSGIHCSHLIEHFYPEDTHKILKEMDRVLDNNGFLIIRTPLLWNKFYSDLTHVKPYNPEAIIHYFTPSDQRTLENINGNYSIVKLKYRYKQLNMNIKYFNAITNILNRWGFPWLKRNGYMLILKKQSDR